MKSTSSRWMLLIALLAVARIGQSWIGGVVETIDEGRPKELVRPLESFPKRIDDWTSEDQMPRPEVVAALKDDRFLQRIYRHPSGLEVTLFFCHSTSGRDAYHYPTVCMTGRGWTEEESQRTTLDIDQIDAVLPAPKTRFRFINDRKDRQLVYYWYYLIGESRIDEAMRRLSQSSRLFLRGRTNAGLTVEIFSGTTSSRTEEIDRFASRVAEELVPMLPPHTRGECELGANL
ncbi:EpsI family protein [bacterium]|nr:EpsI family protein [bacterium]